MIKSLAFLLLESLGRMKKSEIVNNVSSATGVGKPEVQVVIEAFIAEVIKTLKNKNYVEIRRFGKFYIKKRKAKVARDITKNIAIRIPETHVPSFRPAKNFVEIVKKAMHSEFSNME